MKHQSQLTGSVKAVSSATLLQMKQEAVKIAEKPPMDKDRWGLHRRYHVRRLNDINHKHDKCWFFVLDIEHDKHARTALTAYALAVKNEYPQLAEDLFNKLLPYDDSIEGEE